MLGPVVPLAGVDQLSVVSPSPFFARTRTSYWVPGSSGSAPTPRSSPGYLGGRVRVVFSIVGSYHSPSWGHCPAIIVRVGGLELAVLYVEVGDSRFPCVARRIPTHFEAPACARRCSDPERARRGRRFVLVCDVDCHFPWKRWRRPRRPPSLTRCRNSSPGCPSVSFASASLNTSRVLVIQARPRLYLAGGADDGEQARVAAAELVCRRPRNGVRGVYRRPHRAGLTACSQSRSASTSFTSPSNTGGTIDTLVGLDRGHARPCASALVILGPHLHRVGRIIFQPCDRGAGGRRCGICHCSYRAVQYHRDHRGSYHPRRNRRPPGTASHSR